MAEKKDEQLQEPLVGVPKAQNEEQVQRTCVIPGVGAGGKGSLGVYLTRELCDQLSADKPCSDSDRMSSSVFSVDIYFFERERIEKSRMRKSREGTCVKLAEAF
jgi:hypothetical protein